MSTTVAKATAVGKAMGANPESCPSISRRSYPTALCPSEVSCLRNASVTLKGVGRCDKVVPWCGPSNSLRSIFCAKVILYAYP
jgi:hypothetical protein